MLEVASPSTAAKYLDFKRRAYAATGVPEHWLFDPKGTCFRPGSRGCRGWRCRTAGTHVWRRGARTA